MKPDGAELTIQQFIGGHPEWDEGRRMIGARSGLQVLYDVDKKAVVGQLGDPTILPKPGGDIALSGDGRWFANGFSRGRHNYYVILDRSTGAHIRTPAFSRGPYQRGELRIDPAPRWNRSNNMLLVPGFTDDGTRQLFVIRIGH
jgi:hypothetical protein